MTILTISSLPIHEHGMSFHLSSLISSIFCSFECTGLSPTQLNLFYVFGGYTIVKRAVFSIFLLDCSLLAYRNVAEHCVLILYPATLLNY